MSYSAAAAAAVGALSVSMADGFDAEPVSGAAMMQSVFHRSKNTTPD